MKDLLAGTVRRNCTEFARSWQITATDPQIGPALLQLTQTKADDEATRQATGQHQRRRHRPRMG